MPPSDSMTNTGTFGTVSSTGITFSNATGSGNLQSANLYVTSVASTTGLTFGTATGTTVTILGVASTSQRLLFIVPWALPRHRLARDQDRPAPRDRRCEAATRSAQT